MALYPLSYALGRTTGFEPAISPLEVDNRFQVSPILNLKREADRKLVLILPVQYPIAFMGCDAQVAFIGTKLDTGYLAEDPATVPQGLKCLPFREVTGNRTQISRVEVCCFTIKLQPQVDGHAYPGKLPSLYVIFIRDTLPGWNVSPELCH